MTIPTEEQIRDACGILIHDSILKGLGVGQKVISRVDVTSEGEKILGKNNYFEITVARKRK